jgi:transcriptional regulator with XRE-family HTH domain
MRRARENLGWSVRAMAESLEVTERTYKAYEGGAKPIPVDAVWKLARVTRIAPGFLLPEPEHLNS